MNHSQTSATRNPQKSSPAESVYDDGYLRVEYDSFYVAVGGRKLKLGRTEFQLISILTRERDRYIPAETIWRHLWTENKPLNSKSLRVFIHNIRRRLAPFGIYIESMINVGYRLLASKVSD